MGIFRRKDKSVNKECTGKMIVYGNSGFGKSYVIISKILREHDKVVLVSANGDAAQELEFMDLDGVDINVVEPKDFPLYDKVAIPKNGIPSTKRREFFLSMLDKIESSGFSGDGSRTIIFSGFDGSYVEDVVKRLTAWSCQLVIEYAGKAEYVESHEIPGIMKSDEWEKYPLYNSLRPGAQKFVSGLYFVIVKDAKKLYDTFSVGRNVIVEPRRLFGKDGFLVKVSNDVDMTEIEQMAVFEKFMDMVNDSGDWNGDSIRSVLSGGDYGFRIYEL